MQNGVKKYGDNERAENDGHKDNPTPKIKLLVGLGNPGSKHQNTYHNIGFLALNWLVDNYGDAANANEKKFKTVKRLFEYCKTGDLIWLKPLVFMNESGRAVSQSLKYFKVRPENIMVIHDDSDLKLGKFKLSLNRGSAGHKGVESIISSLCTKKFWRLRIGIRSAGREEKSSKFVLNKIGGKEQKLLPPIFKEITEAIEHVIQGRH